MPRDELALYLVLAPEFGGTRFGPFEGLEVRIGSEPGRSDITVPESLGARPQHVRVLRQGAGSFLLSPAERAATVWLWQGQARRPAQVTTATAIRPGDSFALGTAEGPRFTVELAPLPPEILAQRRPKGRQRRAGFGVWVGEMRRLLFARLYTFSFVALGARAWYAVTSGAIFHPRILLPMLAILSGYSACGASSCAAYRYRSQVSVATRRADDCDQDLAYARNLGDNVEGYAFDQLVTRITGTLEIGRALQNDPALAQLVKDEAKQIALDTTGYRWITQGDSRQAAFATWRERVDGADGVDPGTRALLPYLAAVPDRLPGDWDRVLDSRDTLVCGRGPVRLTWRQGRNLGLASVGLDAYTPGDASAIEPAARMALLARTAETGGLVLPAELASTAQVLSQGAATCVYQATPDDREDLGKVLRMVAEQTGRSGKYLPAPEDAFGPVARVAKLFAADIPEVNWRADPPPLDFRTGAPSGVLKKAPGGDKVLRRTAEVVARALVLPCTAALGGERQKMEAVFGKLPEPVPCLVLNYRLTHD